ncbi:hypothetical protein [Salisediminibacterium selenitireducens]|uniref:hypothetical protein n=1 Tax=Salisediminibacterium selenitireducens TaxID=85683 RepID=UPI0012D82831|nr:hypothetical protein [Salisediminibacterium selenitireducens]
MKTALLFSVIAFVVVFLSSLQQNTVITSLFRGSIGLLPGALFGIILAYIWYLTAINVKRTSSTNIKESQEEEMSSENSQDTERQPDQDDEEAKRAAEFVKTKLND